MPAIPLDDAFATAKELHRFCQTEPSMRAYQPLSTSALEISTIPATGKKASFLAVHAVKRTRALIMDGFGIPLSPARREGLDKFESTLDMIRRHIESIPEPGSKSQRIFSGLRFRRESAQLKAELDRVYDGLLDKHHPRSSASRHESILEVVSLSTQAAGIALDLPVLNVLKSLVGMAALICHTAKTVNTNRTAAIALAGRAQEVTTYIVDHATELHADGRPNINGEGALIKLRHTLRDIQAFLKILQNRRKRSSSWLFAMNDKERFAEYNSALDQALSVFSTSEVIETAGLVRSNTQQLIGLVAAVDRVEGDIKRTVTGIHSTMLEYGSTPDLTAFVPLLFHQSQSQFFFFR